MVSRSPLPVRRGINATRLRLPHSGPWDTVLEYVLDTFGHIDHGDIVARFDDGEVVNDAGEALNRKTPLGVHDCLWYYRSATNETPLPVTETVLYQDEHLVVVDKPHFLPTTPAGRYVQESLLVRLRNRLKIDDLIPIHRLDRGTAGLVLLSKKPETRGAYQVLFENRAVAKTYECISRLHPGFDPSRFPLQIRNRISKTKGVVVSELVDYDHTVAGKKPWLRAQAGLKGRRRTEPLPGANACSRVELLATGTNDASEQVGHFRLTPLTGKTHQLRIHMALLGVSIMNDRFYPVLLDDAPDDFTSPLQLLAREVRFTDPISRESRVFRSRQALSELPHTSSDHITGTTQALPPASVQNEHRLWVT